jgi:hypothetical protein
MECIRDGLDVHPGVVGKDEPKIRPSFKRHELTKLRKQGGERRVG